MEIASGYAARVVEDFFGWAEGFDETGDESHGVSYDLLQDYIFAWLEQDAGVKISGGDYGSYLLAVLVVIHEYTKNPSRLDYRPYDAEQRERRVVDLIDLDRPGAGRFDRQMYQQEVFHQLLDPR
jgi:hypothetical protein